MAQYIASKRLDLGGKTYERDQPIPADAVRGLPDGRLGKLVEHRFVREDSVRVSGKKER